MHKLLLRVLFFTLLAVTLALVLPSLVAQAEPPIQGGPPQIPHAKEGHTDCLSCHAQGLNGAPKYPPDHTGRTNDMCLGCHQFKPGTPAVGAGAPVPTATAPAPVIIPTRVPHLAGTPGQDSCVDCHLAQGGASADIVKQHVSSIHAARGVTCTDCHGGDSSKKTKEEAMAASAGFVGARKATEIPGLCGSCHARVDLMRQYDIPTDQYAQYLQSVHGLKLAQGDTNVATCFICHDQHGTKEVNDPTSNVYPQNVPKLCASCHSNATLMKPYGIPTNQYDLYLKSVHGVALLQNQDPRAPTCETCHGTHGASPPGFSEVANVCGSCHSATQDYYLKSVHANNAPGTPKCVTCHGRYDVMTPSEAMFTGTDIRDCSSCHPANSPQAAAVKQLSDMITASAKAYDDASNELAKAAGTGLIVAPEEVNLASAKTNLVTARAAQHTLSIDVVKAQTDKAIRIANQVQADAKKAEDESIFRREAMAIGLVVLALAVGSLYLIRRELYSQLPPKE